MVALIKFPQGTLPASKKSPVGGALRHPAVLNSPLPIASFYFAAR
jgi:hypothetical protein